MLFILIIVAVLLMMGFRLRRTGGRSRWFR